MGVQSLQEPEARSASKAEAPSVTAATMGPAAMDAPSGTSCTWLSAMGRTVAVISIRTVPETTGVINRRRSGSQAVTTRKKSAATTIRLASMAGPPASSARTEIGMNLAVMPMSSTCPDPTRPHRTACRIVLIPAMIRAANTAHLR